MNSKNKHLLFKLLNINTKDSLQRLLSLTALILTTGLHFYLIAEYKAD